MELSNIIGAGHYKVVDVRTPSEFMGGHVAGSVNIPLQEIPGRLSELKAITESIILCCASGGRSFQAASYLNGHGITCYDGGSWMTVNYLTNQKVNS